MTSMTSMTSLTSSLPRNTAILNALAGVLSQLLPRGIRCINRLQIKRECETALHHRAASTSKFRAVGA
jgi:hypothetical protein